MFCYLFIKRKFRFISVASVTCIEVQSKPLEPFIIIIFVFESFFSFFWSGLQGVLSDHTPLIPWIFMVIIHIPFSLFYTFR